jgi:hypothetical protein
VRPPPSREPRIPQPPSVRNSNKGHTKSIGTQLNAAETNLPFLRNKAVTSLKLESASVLTPFESSSSKKMRSSCSCPPYTQERRKSLRVASLPTSSYQEVQEEAAKHAERLNNQFGGGGGSGSGGGRQFRFSSSDWSWEDDDASNDSITNQAAFTAGAGGNGNIGGGGRSPPGPAFVKLMLPSHVSGGYWLQAPYGIGDFLPDDTTTVVLQCDGEEWKTVWLVRSANNGGLSGGWRGFAVDQRLAVGDACVFTKERGLRLRVTVHRAHLCGGDIAAAESAFAQAEAHTDALFATVDDAATAAAAAAAASTPGGAASPPPPAAPLALQLPPPPHGNGTSRALHVYSRRRQGRYDAAAAAAARWGGCTS